MVKKGYITFIKVFLIVLSALAGLSFIGLIGEDIVGEPLGILIFVILLLGASISSVIMLSSFINANFYKTARKAEVEKTETKSIDYYK